MNEPTPAPAIDAATARRAAPSAPEEVVHASVPAPAVPPPASSEDQLPTSRLQSLPLELPPPVPPHGPAHKTQPLRPITREVAAAKLAAEAKVARRRQWQAVVAHVKRAAVAVPSGFAGLRSATWTPRRVGIVFGTLGVTMIACALVLGWQGVQGVALDRFEKAEHASLAVAIVLARAAMAIATMLVGYGLLRVGERALASGAHARRGRYEADVEGDAS